MKIRTSPKCHRTDQVQKDFPRTLESKELVAKMELINLKYYNDDKTEVYRKKRDELYRQAMQEIQLTF